MRAACNTFQHTYGPNTAGVRLNIVKLMTASIADTYQLDMLQYDDVIPMNFTLE